MIHESGSLQLQIKTCNLL